MSKKVLAKVSENQVVQELVNNINNKEINSDDDVDHNFNNKNLCKAAVKLTTYGKAYEYRMNNKEVYLVNEETKDGTRKTNAYIRCSKSASKDGCDFCHIHQRTFERDSKSVKHFDNDVIPKDSSDKTKWLANLKDDFFDNMRKKKKKENTNSFVFPSEADPILLILNNKNSKISSMLYKYATKLLKDIDIKDTIPNSKKSSSKKEIESKKVSKTISKKDESDDEYNFNKKIESDNESENNVSDNDSDEELINKKNNDSDEEELDIDTEIYTNDGELYYLKDNIVFKPLENSECVKAGLLIEISEKYHTVKHEGKLFSIFLKEKHFRKGDIYICIVSNKIFNSKFKLIGTAVKKNNNQYDLKFKDEL